MAGINTEPLVNALRQVVDAGLGQDIVTLHWVHDLAMHEGKLHLTVRLPQAELATRERMARLEVEIRQALRGVAGIQELDLKFEAPAPAANRPAAGPAGLPGVRHIIAIGSGKGGVGKTTVAVNLAIALAEMGELTGLLDADVYGPNVPRMLGLSDSPRVINQQIEPLTGYGVKAISMGLLNPGDKPVIWRGPMLHSAVQQFLRQVAWGELDYLLIDLPPGTGDISLSLAQSVPLSGAVVVTTPSEVALEDGRKALNMFRHLQIPILGLVENMASFTCPHCHEPVDIFSHGGGERIAGDFEVPYLGSLPLDARVRAGGDRGQPPASLGAGDALARPFYELAGRIRSATRQETTPHPAEVLTIRA